MEVSLYQAAAAMNATERWQDLIAGNLASASTPGARKQEISFSAVQAGLAAQIRNGQARYVIPTAIADDRIFNRANCIRPGNPWIWRSKGPGFHRANWPTGRQPTRATANFKSTSRANSSTTGARWCMGDNGPLQLKPGISRSHHHFRHRGCQPGAAKKGKLQITEFNKPGLLTPLGGGMFRADDADLASNVQHEHECAAGFHGRRQISRRPPKWPALSPPCGCLNPTRKCSRCKATA